MNRVGCHTSMKTVCSLFLKGAPPLNRVLPDGTEEWRAGDDEICPIYRKKYESRAMTMTFAKAAWLRYIDGGEYYYELSSLEAQDELLDTRRSPAHLVDDQINSNVASNVWELRVDDVPEGDDDWDLEGAVGLDT